MHEDGFVQQDAPEGEGKVEEDGLGEGKLVPVSESIRYRKRAQAAETKLEELGWAYQKQERELGALRQQMESIEIEQRLKECVVAAKPVDIETAMLVVRQRLGCLKGDCADFRESIQDAIDQISLEKPFLFGLREDAEANPRQCISEGEGRLEASPKTQGVKPVRSGNVSRVLQQAAESAVQSGSRSDVQEYLRIKRQVV